MTEETTTEQLAEIEEQGQYILPAGWQKVPLDEPLKGGDEYHEGLDRYIRRIEPQPQPEPVPQLEALKAELAQVAADRYALQQQTERQKGRIEFLETLDAGNAVAIVDYRAKIEKLQGLIGFANQQLEAAANEISQQRSYLDKYDKQLDQKDAQIRRLQIELDAAQQVPADSPELRQLRADLAEMTQDRDTYRHAHELLVQDVNATHQRTKAMTVEAIAEWLEPIRLADSAYLANATMQHLPSIMRHLTGLNSHAID